MSETPPPYRHGGKRPDAGRKPGKKPTKAIALRVSPEAATRFARLANEADLTQAAFFERLVLSVPAPEASD